MKLITVPKYEHTLLAPKGFKFDLNKREIINTILGIRNDILFINNNTCIRWTGNNQDTYSASCSTKALNYSTGFWDGSRDNDNAFIFITRFVMGNEQKCKNFKYSGADKGYDSVHGLNKDNGDSLLNDEYIVYDTQQTLL